MLRKAPGRAETLVLLARRQRGRWVRAAGRAVRAAGPWLVAAGVAAVPPLLVSPGVCVFEAFAAVLLGGVILSRRVGRGSRYGRAVWVCRVRLAWWAWRAKRRR